MKFLKLKLCYIIYINLLYNICFINVNLNILKFKYFELIKPII